MHLAKTVDKVDDRNDVFWLLVITSTLHLNYLDLCGHSNVYVLEERRKVDELSKSSKSLLKPWMWGLPPSPSVPMQTTASKFETHPIELGLDTKVELPLHCRDGAAASIATPMFELRSGVQLFIGHPDGTAMHGKMKTVKNNHEIILQGLKNTKI